MSQEQNIVEFCLSGGGGNTSKSSSVGGWISELDAGIVQTNTVNNLFSDVSRSNAIGGITTFRQIYVRIKSNTEGLPSAKFWLDKDTQTDENKFEWALETDFPSSQYHYEPYKYFDDDDDFSTYSDDPSLDLVQFSCAAWVYFEGFDFTTTGVIVIKNNFNIHNYGIWIDADNKINGGFHDGTSTHYATAPTELTNWAWHHVVVTYDGATVKLYIDGNTTPVATHSTTATPLVGTGNLTIGRNSMVSDRWFTGGIDEVYVWSNDLTTSEIAALYSDGTVPQLSNLRFNEHFGATQHLYRYQPSKYFDGVDNYTEQAHASNLNLVQFSVSCWMLDAYGGVDDKPIVTKGKFGSALTTDSHNYVIYMRGSDHAIVAGFEEQNSTAHYATSPLAYNDYKWHHYVVTYDQVTVRLYIDGFQVGTNSTTTTPATNTHPLRIGRDAGDVYLSSSYVDEVYVWNNDLTATEVMNMFYHGTIPQTGAIVYEQHYGDDNGSRIGRQQKNEWFEPEGLTWNSQSSPPEDPNFYVRDLAKYYSENSYSSFYPIWIKRTIYANSNDSIDNKGQFKLTGILRRTNTPQGGTNQDGTGGTDTPSPADNVKFGFTADTDCNSSFDRVLDEMKGQGCQKLLFAGDQTYNGTSCWFSRVEKKYSLSNVYGIIGNHDEDGGKRSTWLSKLKMGRGWWYKVVENIGIIGMDSESSFSTGSDQYDDILAWLKKADADSNIDWIIVMIHRPFFGGNSDHDVNEGNKADIYLPLFTKYHVDFVLQAHNHNVQITKLLKDNPNNHESPTIVESSSPYAKHRGFVGIYSGSGGHNGPDASDGDLYSVGSWSQNAYTNDEENGFVMLSFEGTDNSTCKIKFINVDSETYGSATLQ